MYKRQDASNLKHWYKEYSESNDLHKGRKKVSKFSDREKRDAVDYYFAHDRNALQTVKALGYPSRPLLIQWVKELCPEEGKRRCKSFKSHVRCSQEEKIQAVMESCKGNLKIAQIAEIYGAVSYTHLLLLSVSVPSNPILSVSGIFNIRQNSGEKETCILHFPDSAAFLSADKPPPSSAFLSGTSPSLVI